MTPLERITERVSRHGDVNLETTMRPILTLAEFFEGNDVSGTIGCNLDPQPTSSEFYQLLKAIAARPNVADVRVVITQFDVPEWPFSDTVWVVTSAPPMEVASWFDEAVRPSECWAGWYEDEPTEHYDIPAGMKVVTCQWD
jgi:hypothetical protein